MLFSCGCDKKNKTIIETIQLRDAQTIQRIISLTESEVVDKNATTFFLVRHAEKTKDSSDPLLTKSGKARAQELARLINSISLDGIYSSDFRRTKLTAEPTALDQNIETKFYDHKDLEGAAQQMLNDFPKGKILVSGHSNTTPKMLNILTETNDWSSLSETDYDNFYIVSVYENKAAKVLHFKYGAPNAN